MDERPPIGVKVESTRGVIGLVTGYPVKPKHTDKVLVLKQGTDGKSMTGCNAHLLIKFKNLEVIR